MPPSPSLPKPSQAAASLLASTNGSRTPLTPHPHPIRSFAAATKECSASSQAYGECIMKSYKDVEKGMCKEEFGLFKGCVEKVMGRKW
ncbi:hypothetical protein BDY24DRAFT_416800 [Mrakia frigida]|uniref:uncharacterized protein n=1 Tax=Mrakia frigida TaxID=29902 RepID=UPI003FCBF96E